MRQRFSFGPLDRFILVLTLAILPTSLSARASTVLAPAMQSASFTSAQIAQCPVAWDQDARSGETVAIATVQGYTYKIAADNGTPVTLTGVTWSGAGPTFHAQSTAGAVPANGRTAGAHTLTITATDPADGSTSVAASLTYTVADPLGPMPAPRNFKLILIGTIIGGFIVGLVALHKR